MKIQTPKRKREDRKLVTDMENMTIFVAYKPTANVYDDVTNNNFCLKIKSKKDTFKMIKLDDFALVKRTGLFYGYEVKSSTYKIELLDEVQLKEIEIGESCYIEETDGNYIRIVDPLSRNKMLLLNIDSGHISAFSDEMYITKTDLVLKIKP